MEFVQVNGPVKMVTAGQKHTCVLDTQGGIKCWGSYVSCIAQWKHKLDDKNNMYTLRVAA